MAAPSVTEKDCGFQYPYRIPDTDQLNIEDLSTFADQVLIALKSLEMIDQLGKIEMWLAEHPEDSHARN